MKWYDWYIDALKHQYARFDGRAQREAFWLFGLANVLAYFVAFVLARLLDLEALPGLYGLAVLVPSLAIGARRLHDTGRSGWWQLIQIVPIIGFVVLIVFFVQPGDPGDNRYGPPPAQR